MKKDKERFLERRRTGLEIFLLKTRSKMAKFRSIQNLGMGLERWKDENWKRTAKNGITNPKKDKEEWKDPFQERENMKKAWKEKGLF